VRRTPALIVGGGPAGSAAAIMLARLGARPLLIERQRETGDALCGGFLSWRTLARLERLGLDRPTLGGAPVHRVRMFAEGRVADTALPAAAVGVSRHRLDSLLLALADRSGAAIERGVGVREANGRELRLADGASITGESLFLATGKHELRGLARDAAPDPDPWAGLRVRLHATPRLARLVGDAVELHLFAGGYAGLVLQEDGTGNLCVALRKSALARGGGRPAALFEILGRDLPALGDRLAEGIMAQADAVAAVPYGWRARESAPGLFRLGDQAAVIPSLAGEGIDIALASGMAAATAWAKGGAAAAPAFQRRFAATTRRPIAFANLLKTASERPALAGPGVALFDRLPRLARALARLTRVAD